LNVIFQIYEKKINKEFVKLNKVMCAKLNLKKKNQPKWFSN